MARHTQSASGVSSTPGLQMFWTPLLALVTLQCGFCSSCTVDYSARTLQVTPSSITIPCRYRCPSHHRVQATIWTRIKRPGGGRQCIVYHTQENRTDPSYRGRTEFLGDLDRDCTLLISELRYSDEGYYQFTVVTDMYTFSPIEEVHLDFYNYLAGLCQVGIISPREEQEGKEAMWTCFNRNCGSRAHPRWYDSKGGLITQGTSRQDSDSDIHLSITLKWQDHQRTIQCADYYDGCHNCLVASATQIQVKYSPKGIQAILLSARANRMKLGDTVSMRCMVTSSNPLVYGYTWYKDGYETHFQLESDLMMGNLKATDCGNYSCVAHNAIGSSLPSPPIRIRVKDGCHRKNVGLKRSRPGLWTCISLAAVVAVSTAAAVSTWRYIKNKKKGNTTAPTEVQQESRHFGPRPGTNSASTSDEAQHCTNSERTSRPASSNDTAELLTTPSPARLSPWRPSPSYENVDNHYTALDRSQISPEYDCLRR